MFRDRGIISVQLPLMPFKDGDFPNLKRRHFLREPIEVFSLLRV